MRKIKATVFAILAIIVVMLFIAQTGNIGLPSEFNIAALVIIGIIVISLIRTWLRP